MSTTSLREHAIISKARRKARARMNFKALVRLVIANLEWLLEEGEDDETGENVQKNIQKSLRKKERPKSLLTFSDKVILNKPLHLRTEANNHQLLKAIGNLSCFRRYPVDVKTQLPTVMYFAYFGANRVIIRQDAEPHNMYVIVSGEVQVTRTDWDRQLKSYVTKQLGVMAEGTIVGEVSLLNGILRTATLTTITPCEFLYLQREDFDRVLKSTVAALWQEVTQDMSRFEFFDHWGEIRRREACILSRKADFNLDQIVVGNGIGYENYVHFVTKGSCYMIEYVLLRVYETNGSKRFVLASEKESVVKPAKIKAPSVREIIRTVQKQQGDLDESLSLSRSSRVTEASRKTLSKQSILNPGGPAPQRKKRNCSVEFSDVPIVCSTVVTPSYKLRWHFIEVCRYRELACFNLGENLKNRLLVAGSSVTECFMLPRYFLMETEGSIFKKLQYYLSYTIPDTNGIFKEFLLENKWKRYKEKLVADILSRQKKPNFNSINNVPYSIRLADDVGFRSSR